MLLQYVSVNVILIFMGLASKRIIMNTFLKVFLNNFKTYSAVASGLAFFICMIVSLLATSNLFSAFGIDFFARAELGDYIITGVRKITGSLGSFLSAAILVMFINAIFNIYDAYVRADKRAIKSKIAFTEYFRFIGSPVSLVIIFVLVSVMLIVSDTDSLDSKAIKSAETDIKSLRYGKNETELKCMIFIGDVGSFSHYWSITDRSVKSVNTSSILLIETMFHAIESPYLTFPKESAKPELESGFMMKPSKPPRPLTSPDYDKWRNEKEVRAINIAKACHKS